MNNPQILEIIENLKGRRNYEAKKASKLGFSSLYAYIENKVLKEKETGEAELIKQTQTPQYKTKEKKSIKNKSCSCC